MASFPDLPGQEEADFKVWSSSHVDLSPAATTVAFDPVVPLARLPVQAGTEDAPEKGPFLLAFRDEDSWRQAWARAEDRLVGQCEAGARMGCSIRAARDCQPPWWQRLLPAGGRQEQGGEEQQEACEERQMAACMEAAQEGCRQMAQRTCAPAFSDLRIAERRDRVHPRFLDGRGLAQARAANQAALRQPQERSPEESRGGGGALRSPPGDSEAPPSGRSTVRSTRGLSRSSEGRPTGRAASSSGGGPREPRGMMAPDDAEGYEGGLIHPKRNPKHRHQLGVDPPGPEPPLEEGNLWEKLRGHWRRAQPPTPM